MIEKGMNPKNRQQAGPEPFKTLKWGLLMVGSGIGLFIAYMLDLLIKDTRSRGYLFWSDCNWRRNRSDHLL